MKSFSVASKPPNKATAWACFVTNVLVTPGLGSIVAGSYLIGILILIPAVTGFLFILFWFLRLFQTLFQDPEDVWTRMAPSAWIWKTGLSIFLFGWFLALLHSIYLLWHAKATANPKP